MLKKYRVIGGRKIKGHKPGSEFEAELEPDHEARLMKLGHIEIVEDEPEAPLENLSELDVQEL